MARKAGLGRGLDALFADVAPINEEEYNADNLKGLSSSAEETALKHRTGAQKQSTATAFYT